MLDSLDKKSTFCSDKQFEELLEELRAQIDRVDNELIEALASRMKIATEIGKAKSEARVTLVNEPNE